MNAFKINTEEMPAASLNTLIEVYAQNEVILDGLAMLLSLNISLPIETVELAQRTKIDAARNKIRDLIFEKHGSININDISKG